MRIDDTPSPDDMRNSHMRTDNARSGTLHGIGIGPGDPELMTLKAVRLLGAAPVVAFFAKRGQSGHARRVAAAHLHPETEELRLEYPVTTEIPVADPDYAAALVPFYAEAAERIAARLDRGLDVAVLCEGDPFLYGSFMHLFDRLAGRYRSEVVPGVTGMSGCWTRALVPMAHGDDVLSVLPGTLDEEHLVERLRLCDAAVIMKVGRNLPKIRAALARAGLIDRAIYVERGTMPDERIEWLAGRCDLPAPYFSLVLVPGRRGPR